MRIDFILKQSSVFITSMHDMPSNPFNVGDIIHLDVHEITPVEFENYKPEKIEQFRDTNNEQQKMFKHKSIKLIDVEKYMEIKTLRPNDLVIEYYCEYVDEN